MNFIIDMCLLCNSNTKDLISLETRDSCGVTIKEKITTCITNGFKTLFETDIPLSICFECYAKLNYSYGFQQISVQSIDKFENFVNKVGLEEKGNYKSLSVNLQNICGNEKVDKTRDGIKVINKNSNAKQKRNRNNNIKLAGCASNYLKNEIFPVLKNDEIAKCISCDEVAVLYGNKLCEKLHSSHSPVTIRARLRLLGRFLIAVKKIDPKVTDLKSAFILSRFDKIMSAAQKITTSRNTASHVKLIFKQILVAMIAYCIKNSLSNEKKELEIFLSKWKAEFHFSDKN